MVANHLLTGFAFGLSLSVVSWIVGIIGTALLQKTRYFEALSHLNFIPSRALNTALGIEPFKWLVKNSVFRFLNQSIKVAGKQTDLALIRHEMTRAEIGHLIGFLFVAAAAVYQSNGISLIFGLSMMLPNVVLNAYPSLLQQENKRRIDQLLNRRARHSEARR
jgi:Glycosyl-4,4'-diaponeurosporenoate acyltransferase